MIRKRARLRQSLAIGSAPPSEVRIFKYGEVDTTKGTFLFDAKAAKLVMAEWKAYGNDLCFDYEHKSVDPEGRAGDGKAAGWFKLELRADGLYAVGIKWTDQAAHQIAAKEWRYYSPTFDFDPKTGRILSLLNVALTNIPATKNLPALVAAAKGKQKMLTKAQKAAALKKATALLAKMGSAITPEDVAKLEAAIAKSVGGDKKVAQEIVALGVKKTKKTVTEVTEDDGGDAAAAQPCDDGEDVAMDDGDLDAGDDIAMDEGEMDEGDLDEGEADEGDLEEDDADDAPDSDAAPSPPAKKAPPPAPTKPMKKAAATRLIAAAARAFGTSDPDELEGAFMGVAEMKKQVEKLTSMVDKSNARHRRETVKAMIEGAIREGRLMPAQRASFTEIGLESPKRLKGLLATMPKRVRMRSDDDEQGSEPGPSGAAGLTQQGRAILRRAGVDFTLYENAQKSGKLLTLDHFTGGVDDESN